MFEKTRAPILGVIENMAWFEAPDGTRTHIFGEGGAQRTAQSAGVPFLVILDEDGIVRSKGTVNSLEQIEGLIDTARRRIAEADEVRAS